MEENTIKNKMVGGTVKELAGKTLSDPNYQYLCDKGTQNLINAFIKANPQLKKVALTSQDYLSISNEWNAELTKPTELSTGLSVTQIKEKSAYYQKASFERAKEERWERKEDYHSFIGDFVVKDDVALKSKLDAFNKLPTELQKRYITHGVEDTVNVIQDTKRVLLGADSLEEVKEVHSKFIEEIKIVKLDKLEGQRFVLEMKYDAAEYNPNSVVADAEKEKYIREIKNIDEKIQEINNFKTGKMEKTFDKEKYLQNQMKYLGFGESEKLHEDLKKGLESNQAEFTIKTSSDKATFSKLADFTLNFKKIESGAVFLNSYDANLTNSKGENLSHRFKVKKEDNITVKEAINLLEGRAIKTTFVNKDSKEKEPVFIKLKLNEEKNEYGNYKLDIYNKNYGVDTAKIVEKSNLIFDKPEFKDFTIKSLEKGNLATVKFKHEDKVKEGKAMLNPQYKTLNLYDSNMNRINTNKPIKGLEIEQTEKGNTRQQNTKRSL